MIHTTNLKIGSLGSSGYPYVELHMTDYDAVNGVSMSFFASAVVAGKITVSVVGKYTCEEDVLANIAGNTFYNVNTGAAAKKVYGTIELDFSTLLENKIDFKPGTIIAGGITFPAIMPPMIGFVLANTDISLVKVVATRRLNPAGA